MNIITTDTILDKTYISVSFGEKEIFKTLESNENGYHSALLIKVLKEILSENNFDIKKLDYFGANVGVGSFTGIRVNLAIAKIISNRLNIKVAPLNTMEVLSRAYKNKNIMLDARRGSAFYSNDGKNTELISYEKAEEILKSKETFICDNSIKKRFEADNLISFEEKNLDLAKFELEITKEKIKNGETINPFELKPLYIQTPPVFSK